MSVTSFLRVFTFHALSFLFCSTSLFANHENPNTPPMQLCSGGMLRGPNASGPNRRPALEHRVCHRSPIAQERQEIVASILRISNKEMDARLFQAVIAVTERYNEIVIRGLVLDMANSSEDNQCNSRESVGVLRVAIAEHDRSVRTQRQKQELIARYIAERAEAEVAPQDEECRNNQARQYPLLEHVYQTDGEVSYFRHLAAQLQTGQLQDGNVRGVLLHGPPGVGKTQMVKALINESGCRAIKRTASSLVTRYQGSGAAAVVAIFEQAKREREQQRATLIFLDELQSLATGGENGREDFQNTLAQIWTELDACDDEDGRHILFVSACIEFSHPDSTTIRKILTDKARYYRLSLSEAQIETYCAKMRNWSGRAITKCVRNAKTFTSMQMTLEQAVERAFQAEARTMRIAERERLKAWLWDFGQRYVRFAVYRGLIPPEIVGVVWGGAALYVAGLEVADHFSHRNESGDSSHPESGEAGQVNQDNSNVAAPAVAR